MAKQMFATRLPSATVAFMLAPNNLPRDRKEPPRRWTDGVMVWFVVVVVAIVGLILLAWKLIFEAWR